MAELNRAHADAAARLEAMVGLLAKGQSQLAHTVNERLDSVSHRLGNSMEQTKQSTAENLQKLGERLAVIDRAQKNITELATQVTSLQGVLTNKQERGAFGQGRMELIVRDGLPKECYEFQYTLSNRLRPDCCIFLPDKRPLVVDSKFPLEAVTAYRAAKSDDERRQGAARVRADVTKHVSDIAQKYLIPGETQDLALMFVPSESVYAELHDGFDDIVQKAFRAKVIIVSPSIDDRHPRDPADPEGCTHARGGRPYSNGSRVPDRRCQAHERARGEAWSALWPGHRGCAASLDFNAEDRAARRAHRRCRVRR
jgi:DNA recombination protein RmuC